MAEQEVEMTVTLATVYVILGIGASRCLHQLPPKKFRLTIPRACHSCPRASHARGRRFKSYCDHHFRQCKEPFLIVLFEILGGAKGSRYVRVISLPLTRTSLIISFKNAFFEPIAFLSAVSAFL